MATIDEMHIDFEQRLDKVQSNALAEFTIEEIDAFLNTAQLMFVKKRYGYNNIYNQGFEESQKRIDDIRELVLTHTFTNPTTVNYEEEDIYRLDISQSVTDYMFYIRGRVTVKEPECSPTTNSIKIVQQDDLEKVKTDPFNKPKPTNSVGYFEDGDIFIVPGKGTVTQGKVTYVKYPATMIHSQLNGGPVNCELALHTHDEIVELSVMLALNQIESPRQQSHIGILKNKE